jgi:putative hemolysin
MLANQLQSAVNVQIPWLLRQAPKLKPFNRRIHCRVPFEFTVGDFTVKTVQFQHELSAVRRLRYRVFHREFAGKVFPIGHDREFYDQFSDTLIVRDDRSDQIVGTYRMICSSHSHRFYSETEFDISQILALSGTKLELSRACIHRKYRQGRIINLLWRGVARYIQESGADYVFGMGSILTTSRHEISRVMKQLAMKGHLDENIRVPALGEYRMRYDVDAWEDESCIDANQDGLPGLMKSYVKAGAKICSEPALDSKFRCVDLLTLWDVRSTESVAKKRYFKSDCSEVPV